MAFSITQFENSTSNSLVALDNNFTTFGALVPIPCSVAGTNVLTLTQSAAGMVPTPALSAYTTNEIFNGVAAATNTGSVTATVGALGTLTVYKDTSAGPVALSGGELILGCAFSLRYDASLNSGNGGFHLSSSTAGVGAAISPSQVAINGGATLTNLLSGNSPTLTFTATPGWSSQDQTFTLTGLPPALPAPGDFLQVVPSSLAAAGVSYWGMVTALGSLSSVASVATVNIRLVNSASASLASNSGIYRWKAERVVP